MNKVVFSGVQPTGNIHLGNYLGAIRQFSELQEEFTCFYCIVDLHAITVSHDPEELRKNVLDVAALYMATGIDPKKATVFVQSHVKEHTELAWLLMCNSYTGELARMTQFKDKTSKQMNPSAGLFTYPVLMAADILLYDTDVVPVGVDQKQHIELTRNIAIRMNNNYGKIFKIPEGRILKTATRVMSLEDPTKKMSKSNENKYSRISLLDDDKTIKKAVMKAKTDSEGKIYYDNHNKQGLSNLMEIYKAITGLKISEIEQKFEGGGYGDFKKDLVQQLTDVLGPIREKYEEIRKDKYLIDLLYEGAITAKKRANEKILKVKQAMGL